ncbi:MAG: homoserine kinase [Chloroflexia bacterium]
MTREPDPRPLRIRVPATCANLGPGFDVLGLAVELYNTFVVTPSEVVEVVVEGYGEGMPRDESNLFYRSFARLWEVGGQKAPAVRVRMELAVPQGRGLGSSATAVIGGLVAANELMGTDLDRQELLAHAIELEHGRHADNVAPALLGGLVVNVLEGERVISVRVPFPEDLRAVLFVPEFKMDTVSGRSLMPESYSRGDVVFNTSRVALLMAALGQGRYDLLSVAMEDRMHQPYRAKIFPQMRALIGAALEAGAAGACLSGGGSSVLALAAEGQERIAAAMQDVARRERVAGEARVLGIDLAGASCSREGAE